MKVQSGISILEMALEGAACSLHFAFYQLQLGILDMMETTCGVVLAKRASKNQTLRSEINPSMCSSLTSIPSTLITTPTTGIFGSLFLNPA
mmetsp:Transcript_6887/g.16886  ORF Transcript_6887/g.16886 Transcript_6887/m.16886 type:complete len:91 (+) Transcript_6887:227-499(+)